MPTYKQSDGTRIEKSVLDRRISESKVEYGELFLDAHCYIFCERCKGNKYQCSGNASSHIISVDECQKSGRSELAYDITNLERLGHKCHMELEQWSHAKREAWQKFRLTAKGYDEFIKQYKE